MLDSPTRLNILVAGAGGFIGSHMAKRLFEQGHHVRAVDIKWDGFMPEPYYTEKLTLDLRRWENCLEACRDMDLVFQFAADMGGIGYISALGAPIMRNSALINLHMLEASRLCKVRRHLYSSSACVYPRYRQDKADIPALAENEVYPAQPDEFYGWEKLFTELACEAYRLDHGLDVRVVRFHNIYGPHGVFDGGKEKAPAALCRKVAQAGDPGEIIIWGDGKQTRSFCFIEDCLEGVLRLMNSDFNQPLNVGSDEMVTIDQLADIAITVSDKRIEKTYDPSKPQGVRGRSSDNTLIKKALGWAPATSLREGIAKTYPWIQRQVEKQRDEDSGISATVTAHAGRES